MQQYKLLCCTNTIHKGLSQYNQLLNVMLQYLHIVIYYTSV